MSAKFLLVGTVAAGFAIFIWQSVSNTVIPWHEAALSQFKDATAVNQTIRANAPANGVYFTPQGILAAVSFAPDMGDKTRNMAPALIKQLVIDLAAAFVLCLLVGRIASRGALRTGITLAVAALAAAFVLQLSDWNWYGFSTGYSAANIADIVVQFFIAGLVLGALATREPQVAAP